jgi:phosphatidylethanolamine-binding protein
MISWLGSIFIGNFLADYVGPLPSQGAGPHRFIFLVYRQLDGLIDTSRMPRASRCDWLPRARFSVRKFAQLHGLNQPTAVNFFLTQFDASVPQTISQCLRAKP